MFRPKMLGGVACVALAWACAGASKQVKEPAAQAQNAQAKTNGKAVAKEDPRVICRMERPTGSNIPERVCRYVELKSDEETQRTQDMMRQWQGHADPLQGN